MLSASCTSIVPAVCSVGLVRWCEQVAVQSDALDILLRYIFEARPVETASASLQIVSLFESGSNSKSWMPRYEESVFEILYLH